MKSCHHTGLALLFLFVFSAVTAQEQRAFNQNASRSNHTRAFNQNDSRSNNTTRAFNQNSSRSNNAGLSFTFSPVYSTATNTATDSLLFRGSGAGFRFGADYFFGKAGISFSSGFGSSNADDAVINNFLKKSSINPDELIITKTRQQNMYLLLGPSVRFGNKVELYAHAKGGLFINNSGMVSIAQKGAQRAAYRNESTDKSAYPGFLTGISVQYKTRSDKWAFGIGTDYMHTRSEVNNYDARRGGGMEALKLSRNINDLVTGISVRYNINSPRDHSSGQSTGRRYPGRPQYDDINIQPRESNSGLATGRRSYQPGQPVYGNLTADPGCGTVTSRLTHPDGTTEEMVFACPADAAQYSREMTNGVTPRTVTVPKQTQGATFGEKVNAGLNSAAGHLSQRMIISGTVTWSTPGSAMGIVTNRTMGNGTRTTNQSSFGTMVRMSAREAGSGQSTGRRQYEPIFMEGGGSVCNPCLADAKMGNISNNPLYKGKGMSGSNPMHEGRVGGGDDDCDGIGGINVYLIEPASRMVMATTTTEACGDFFFANVPDGDYLVQLGGDIVAKKEYEVSIRSKTDLVGSAEQEELSMQITINSTPIDDEDAAAVVARGVTKTRTKSNNSNDRMAGTNNNGDSYVRIVQLVTGDLDGDGRSELAVATGMLPGGAVVSAAVSRAAPVSGLTITGGKKTGDKRTVQTNEAGEFEFKGLEPGDYLFTLDQPIVIEDEMFIPASTRAQDHNSSRSNKTASSVAPSGGEGNNKVQDHNSSRSNKTASAVAPSGEDGNNKVQDHNSSRSNKTASAIDTDNNDGERRWMAPESLKRSVNASRTNTKNVLSSLDALEEQLDSDGTGERKTINTTRDNIKRQRIAIYELRDALANMEFSEEKTAMNDINSKTVAMNNQFQALEQSLKALGQKFSSISNVLKTKHDIAMNSIRNMK